MQASIQKHGITTNGIKGCKTKHKDLTNMERCSSTNVK
jgi:hypothetical protein